MKCAFLPESFHKSFTYFQLKLVQIKSFRQIILSLPFIKGHHWCHIFQIIDFVGWSLLKRWIRTSLLDNSVNTWHLHCFCFGGMHRFDISIIRWQDGLVLVNNWRVELGGVKVPPPDPAADPPGTSSSLPKRSFLGDFSWAHLLSNHLSRLIYNADNSCNILTKSSESLHWKYQISDKNC